MASVIVKDKSFTSSKINLTNYPISKLENIGNLATVSEISNILTSLEESSYAIAEILPDKRSQSIYEFLPFRVKFTTIGIGSEYANIPGIGLQVIEVNNYIL